MFLICAAFLCLKIIHAGAAFENNLRRSFLHFQRLDEYAYEFRVELNSRIAGKLFQRFAPGKGFAIGAVGRHGIPGVGDLNDPGLQGDGRAFQSGWIS